jgi:hypothetical protein
MQRTTPILFIAGGVIAVGLALGQSLASTGLAGSEAASTQDPVEQPADPALLAKVEELERKVATLEAWVAAQQAQSKLTADALDRAQSAGFTAGINFTSREILLEAWRAEAAKVQEGGPPAPVVVVDPKQKGGAGGEPGSPPR